MAKQAHKKSTMKSSTKDKLRVGFLWFLAAVLTVALAVTVTKLVQWQQAVKVAQTEQSQMFASYDFDPGYIISDNQFFDSDAMTAAEVQTFLEEQGENCSGELCLKNLTVDVQSRDASDECAAYEAPSSGKATAAEVINASARACGISQKVLITILQKEQNLIGRSSVTQDQLDKALGLSCPDTAECDENFAGFFNQVYGAAERFKYYLNHESRYNFHAGDLNSVRFSPDESCGASDVYIYNNATAVLYIYTPYQPNKAALEAGVGEGDACSSYGNRNFSIIYTSYFGSPTKY
ncbi:hypothetical protein [Alloscardovia criceti]|uniref:hypothetical protein n=1 Tax=Alloscardovia criceti TaxID=356828 RepID=UPI000369E157|nr:hypothetical protein [Alloscardovia criceti]